MNLSDLEDSLKGKDKTGFVESCEGALAYLRQNEHKETKVNEIADPWMG